MNKLLSAAVAAYGAFALFRIAVPSTEQLHFDVTSSLAFKTAIVTRHYAPDLNVLSERIEVYHNDDLRHKYPLIVAERDRDGRYLAIEKRLPWDDRCSTRPTVELDHSYFQKTTSNDYLLARLPPCADQQKKELEGLMNLIPRNR